MESRQAQRYGRSMLLRREQLRGMAETTGKARLLILSRLLLRLRITRTWRT